MLADRQPDEEEQKIPRAKSRFPLTNTGIPLKEKSSLKYSSTTSLSSASYMELAFIKPKWTKITYFWPFEAGFF
jgi:hypothetical protein